MPFRDDPRIDRLETLAARISRMYHAADDVFTRQRGNLRHEDRALLREFYRAYADYLDWIRQARSGETAMTHATDDNGAVLALDEYGQIVAIGDSVADVDRETHPDGTDTQAPDNG